MRTSLHSRRAAQVPAFRLFPGQVVAVTATNPMGGRLLATAVRAAAPAPIAASPVDQLASFAMATGASAVEIHIRIPGVQSSLRASLDIQTHSHLAFMLEKPTIAL